LPQELGQGPAKPVPINALPQPYTDGKVAVLSGRFIELSDGTQVDLHVWAPALHEKHGQGATAFLRQLIGDRPVRRGGYVGDVNLEHAMIVNGWAVANHSLMKPAQVIAQANARGQWRKDGDPLRQAAPASGVVRDSVQIQTDKGTEDWERITGKAPIVDGNDVRFGDGTQLKLRITLPQGDRGREEAITFLRKLIGDQPVTCIRRRVRQGQDEWPWFGYVGDVNLEHAMIVNGWATSDHSVMNTAEAIAREHKRGVWGETR
jgi:endonuclease YncB( thermonuclease family)